MTILKKIDQAFGAWVIARYGMEAFHWQEEALPPGLREAFDAGWQARKVAEYETIMRGRS